MPRKAATEEIKKKPGRGLARPGDPLVTRFGQTVQPDNEVNKIDNTPPQQVINPATYRPTKRRTVKELPGEIHIVNAVSVVFMYTLLGVGDREIADSLKTSVEDIIELRNHSAYGECFQIIHGEFINANSELLTSRIAAYSQTALQTVGDLVTNAKKEEVRLRAGIDILDRAGVRPKDQENRGMAGQNHLRIIIVDGEKQSKIEVNLGDE